MVLGVKWLLSLRATWEFNSLTMHFTYQGETCKSYEIMPVAIYLLSASQSYKYLSLVGLLLGSCAMVLTTPL